jgi:hypothetical protein
MKQNLLKVSAVKNWELNNIVNCIVFLKQSLKTETNSENKVKFENRLNELKAELKECKEKEAKAKLTRYCLDRLEVPEVVDCNGMNIVSNLLYHKEALKTETDIVKRAAHQMRYDELKAELKEWKTKVA